MRTLPKDFIMGGATAAYQAEGATQIDGKGPVAWDSFLIEKGRYTAEPASDFYHQYPVDIELCKKFNIDSIRLSIAWSRIFPDGFGEVNQLGVDFYHSVFSECISNGIIPFVTIHHFDTPKNLFEKGDFLNRENIEHFVNFAKFCFEEFKEIEYWSTFNEIYPLATNQYLTGVFPPEIKFDFEKVITCLHNMMYAHARVVNIFKEGNYRGKIGVVHSLEPKYPYSDKPEDIHAAKVDEALSVRFLLDATYLGKYSSSTWNLVQEILYKNNMSVSIDSNDFIEMRKASERYGIKTTVAHFLAQKDETKFSDVRNKLFLDFILKLRKELHIDDSSDGKQEEATEFPKIIWTMWQQGEAHMPETVKASIKTIKDFAQRNGYEFHLLTDEDLLDFVDIPKDIIEKNKRNELTSAAFSDIVRASLLYEHGGIWMDATLFVSPYASIEMFERDLFSLKHPPIEANKMGCPVSGFKWTGYYCLAGKKGKQYFKHIRDLFTFFIRKYPVMIHYLMMDFFILSEYNCNHEFKVLVDELPVLAPAERVWFFRENAGKLFDEKEWEEVLKHTPIMKTTYKFNVNDIVPKSYLYKLYHGELNRV